MTQIPNNISGNLIKNELENKSLEIGRLLNDMIKNPEKYETKSWQLKLPIANCLLLTTLIKRVVRYEENWWINQII